MKTLKYPYAREEKTIQAVAFLIRLHDPQQLKCNMNRILTLAYMSERKAYESLSVIFGGSILLTNQGPVLGNLYNMMNYNHTSLEFNNFITKHHFDLILTKEPGIGKLCRHDTYTMKETCKKYFFNDTWELIDICRLLPEYTKNSHNLASTSFHIPFKDVTEALGIRDSTDHFLKEETQQLEMSKFFDKAEKEIENLV